MRKPTESKSLVTFRTIGILLTVVLAMISCEDTRSGVKYLAPSQSFNSGSCRLESLLRITSRGDCVRHC